MFKGTIPVADESYNLSDPVGTGRSFATVAIGFALLFGAVAVGRAGFNRASQATDAVGEVEVF